MMLNNMMAKEPVASSSSAAGASAASSSSARSYAGSASRSTAGAGTGTGSSSQRSHRQHYPGSSASSVSSVSSSSTTTTNRTAYSEHLLQAEKDKRRPSRLNTSSTSTSSAASSSSTAARARRRTDGESVGTIREDAVSTVDVGPEKFAVKVGAREHYENSSSSSGPGSDKDDTSPQQPSKSSASSSSNSNSNSNSSGSKPSRMIVKRRMLGNSRATSVTSTSIPNKYVRQTSKEEAPPHSGSGQSSMAGEYTINSRAGVESAAPYPGSSEQGNEREEQQRLRSGSHGRRTDASSTTSSQSQPQSTTPRTLARKMLRQEDPDETKEGGDPKARPVRIKYETPTRGIGGGKREISHASLGKLIARLTDAHQYDTQFRDVFLLTFRCFCSPYDFIKKLMKRYTAVLTLCGGLDPETLHETQMVLDQIAEEEENDRSSTSTSISTAKSDINTGMEANVSIMRLLSVLKFWIKESGFIEMDLQGDRRSQKKLMAFLSEIQSTSPVASIRKHAENMLLMVAQLVRMQTQQQHHTAPVILFQPSASLASSSGIPPPPPLVTSTSVSSVMTDSISGDKPRVIDERSTEIPQARDRMLTAAMSKLKLSRSSSDPKRERSMVKLKMKPGGNGDIFQLRPRAADDAQQAKMSSMSSMSSGAPKIMRGVTTGSTDTGAHRFDSFGDSMMYRSRITVPRNSSRTTYDNVEPLSGITAQELADQLTLVEAEHYFGKVSPRELTNKAWTRETKFKEAPNVMALIELFDATAEWVSSEILHPRLQAAERAKMLTFFIDAAENCYQMNNFNTLFEIFTGLSAPCVRQLNTTWGLVGANATEKYQFLHGICSTEDNYRNYRQQFGFAEGQPRLPCWFILVKDLFQYEESMKSTEEGLVNWQKFRKIHRVISEALDRQNLSYLPASGSASSSTGGISRKGKGVLRHDRKIQNHIRHRLETYVVIALASSLSGAQRQHPGEYFVRQQFVGSRVPVENQGKKDYEEVRKQCKVLNYQHQQTRTYFERQRTTLSTLQTYKEVYCVMDDPVSNRSEKVEKGSLFILRSCSACCMRSLSLSLWNTLTHSLIPSRTQSASSSLCSSLRRSPASPSSAEEPESLDLRELVDVVGGAADVVVFFPAFFIGIVRGWRDLKKRFHVHAAFLQRRLVQFQQTVVVAPLVEMIEKHIALDVFRAETELVRHRHAQVPHEKAAEVEQASKRVQLHCARAADAAKARQACVRPADRVAQLACDHRVCLHVHQLHRVEAHVAVRVDLNTLLACLIELAEALDDRRVEPRDAVLVVAALHDRIERLVELEFVFLAALLDGLWHVLRVLDHEDAALAVQFWDQEALAAVLGRDRQEALVHQVREQQRVKVARHVEVLLRVEHVLLEVRRDVLGVALLGTSGLGGAAAFLHGGDGGRRRRRRRWRSAVVRLAGGGGGGRHDAPTQTLNECVENKRKNGDGACL